MLFPTVTFAVFFTAVLAGNWTLRRRVRVRKVFLLAASLVFYGAWDHRFVLLLAGSIVVNQAFAVWSHRTGSALSRRRILAAAVAANVGALGFFKYAGFLQASAVNALNALGFETSPRLMEVLLPVGVSFFTFQALSYVIDVHRRRLRPASHVDFAVYLSFFPQLVAGPIVRGTELLPQIRRPTVLARIDASRAFYLIMRGLFKKTVLATFLATSLIDEVFAAPAAHGSLETLVAVYAYAIQIYADFSGYTDIAIGVALLLGFRFPENFDRPYAATSLQDFWRRWHMTLSRWLRDYLYVPLGGSRGGRWLTYRNVLVTMLLGGLWHGAGWTFVAWGALHGVGLVAGRVWRERAPWRLPEAHASVLRPLATFHLVCLGWVFFRAESFGVAFELLGRILTGAAGSRPIDPVVVLVVAAALAVQHVPASAGERVRTALSELSPVAQGAALAVGLLAIDVLKPSGMDPFIYFRF